MNLPGIPFELILIVLFFVLPALGNLQRRFRGRGGQQGEADTSTEHERRQPSAETSTRPQTGAPSRAPTQASTQTSTQTQPRAESGGSRWLEEAQRRVREAQASEPSGRARPDSRPDSRQATQGKPLFDSLPDQSTARPTQSRSPRPPRPVQARPAGSLEGPASEVRSLETYRPDHTSLESSSAAGLGTAPPLRVQRLGAGKRATINPDKLRFDASTVMNGIAWHQVLSPPLSKRRTRLSQRRP